MKPSEAIEEDAAPVVTLPEVVPDDNDNAELNGAGSAPLSDALDGESARVS